MGYAGYEAPCVVRDGCFGPQAPLGLRPPGTSTTMLPIGIIAAAVVAAAAAVLHREQSRRTSAVIVLGGLIVVSAVRSIGSIWLPHVGDGLTRQRRSSILVAATATRSLVILRVTSRRRERATDVSTEDSVRA